MEGNVFERLIPLIQEQPADVSNLTIAYEAYDYADAMTEARKKKKDV